MVLMLDIWSLLLLLLLLLSLLMMMMMMMFCFVFVNILYSAFDRGLLFYSLVLVSKVYHLYSVDIYFKLQFSCTFLQIFVNIFCNLIVSKTYHRLQMPLT
jgi:hypothetical protein